MTCQECRRPPRPWACQRPRRPSAARAGWDCALGSFPGVEKRGMDIILNRRYIFKWLVFHCHVSFQGCVYIYISILLSLLAAFCIGFKGEISNMSAIRLLGSLKFIVWNFDLKTIYVPGAEKLMMKNKTYYGKFQI